MSETPTVDLYEKKEVADDIKRIDALLACGIFAREQAFDVLFRSAFIDLLINLRDLMYKSEKFARRISFIDDIKVTDTVKDASDLIKYVRDALCHADSDNHYLEDGGVATFNVIFGKGVLVQGVTFELSSPYEDDVCFFFGSQRIYLIRHIRRAFDEAKALLQPML